MLYLTRYPRISFLAALALNLLIKSLFDNHSSSSIYVKHCILSKPMESTKIFQKLLLHSDLFRKLFITSLLYSLSIMLYAVVCECDDDENVLLLTSCTILSQFAKHSKIAVSIGDEAVHGVLVHFLHFFLS